MYVLTVIRPFTITIFLVSKMSSPINFSPTPQLDGISLTTLPRLQFCTKSKRRNRHDWFQRNIWRGLWLWIIRPQQTLPKETKVSTTWPFNGQKSNTRSFAKVDNNNPIQKSTKTITASGIKVKAYIRRKPKIKQFKVSLKSKTLVCKKKIVLTCPPCNWWDQWKMNALIWQKWKQGES